MFELLAASPPRPLRVGLAAVYFPLFDAQMPSGYRQTKEDEAGRRASLLSQSFRLTYPGLITSDADAARARDAFLRANVDVVVFSPTMAAPPSFGLVAVEAVAAPIVIWNALTLETFPEGLDHATAVASAGTVGCLMFANACRREGRKYLVMTGGDGDDERGRVAGAVRAAGCGALLRGATALRIGAPIPGYADVESTQEQLALLGLTEVEVGPQELHQTLESASETLVDDLLRELEHYGVDGSRASARRSARLAVALAELARLHEAKLGTVNCHNDLFRGNPDVGICACLGVSLLTAAGIPFSCTGDQPTAVAMKTAEILSGRSLYCECYAPEPSTGEVLLAAGGEGDLRWAEDEIAFLANDYYPGVNGAGLGVSFKIASGDATLLSLFPVGDRWHLVWAEGSVGPRWHPRLGCPNGMFRFKNCEADVGVTRWIEAGAPHHHALAAGHIGPALRALSALEGLVGTAVE